MGQTRRLFGFCLMFVVCGSRGPKMEAITARLAVVEGAIAQEKAALNAAEGDKASDLRLSLAELRDEKAALLVEKAALLVEKAALLELSLIAARAAAAAPAPGKNPPLAVDASVPPLYANTQHPRSLSRPLVRRDSSLVSNLVSNHVSNSRLCVRTERVRPSCEEG